ncbi:unnamed protein product [Didymodactylos carnosus]|uniref:Uncharacterized protein n=1 Tax=Didymodactylos carnosus TaxID=1234261 RepID=A0A815F7N6_9BILA|nr:unnamed protein product [Didymodactylos carnosus]CAF4169036.1 unnamed protein product [Didymodactylos carnosus]
MALIQELQAQQNVHMFGQKPRCDQEFWKIVQERNTVDEAQLPTPVDDIMDNTVLDDGLVSTDGAMNSPMTIDNDAFPLYDNTTADDVNSPFLLDQSSTSVCAAPVLNPLSGANVSSNDNLISFDLPKLPAKAVSQCLLPSNPVLLLDTPTLVVSSIEPNSKSNSCVNILDELDALVNTPVKTTSLSSLSLSTVVVASSNTIAIQTLFLLSFHHHLILYRLLYNLHDMSQCVNKPQKII